MWHSSWTSHIRTSLSLFCNSLFYNRHGVPVTLSLSISCWHLFWLMDRAEMSPISPNHSILCQSHKTRDWRLRHHRSLHFLQWQPHILSRLQNLEGPGPVTRGTLSFPASTPWNQLRDLGYHSRGFHALQFNFYFISQREWNSMWRWECIRYGSLL